MIINFSVRTKVIYLRKHMKIVCQWINFYFISTPNKRSDSQTNFELSHGNTINNSIIIKMRPFEQQNNFYGNRSAHSKVMTKQRFKKDYDVAL